MKRLHGALVAAGLAAVIGTAGMGAQGAEPYKLGMFQQGTRSFVGMVIQKDSLVVDLSRANVGAPATLKQLIAQWDVQTGVRLATLAASSAQKAPAFAMKVSEVKTLAPIPDPAVLLNAAVNYSEHGIEMTGVATFAASADQVDPKVAMGIPGYWNRKPGDLRHNPYYFMKAPTSITGNGDPIVLPPGRTQIDWECELGVVIGARTSRVDATRARDAIFGYTIENDVSDRGGRGDTRHGSDWLIAKSHDTFAPMGPFIVPKEFVADPQKLTITFALNGQVMQDANTSLMIHTVFEQVSYASHILTLRPGDVISTGSPAGVGSARTPPIFLKAGDLSECTYESVGTLRNPVAGPS